MEEFIPILITALVSPLFLKLVEYVLNKNSESAKSTSTKIEALSRRVDELRDERVQLKIEIGVLRAELAQKDRQIAELQREAYDFRSQLNEKDKQIAELQKEITSLQRNKQNI